MTIETCTWPGLTELKPPKPDRKYVRVIIRGANLPGKCLVRTPQGRLRPLAMDDPCKGVLRGGHIVLPNETIDVATVGSNEFVLARHGDEWVVRVNSRILMSSRMHASEESLAEHGLELFKEPRAVLVGGLGLGFTLRAVLDRVASDAVVTVAELVPELVGWNRKELAELNDHPLDDPRCHVVVGDVFETIKVARGAFDVILLDVDNGPIALSNASNQQLYGERGLRECHRALRPHGVLAVWAAGPSPRFERRFAGAGFDVKVMHVPVRPGARARHVLFLGVRPS
jgi:predicted membrane-bound spermidine synthase